MIRLVTVWSSNSADFYPHPRRLRVLHLSTYALPRVRGFPSPLLCRQLDEHLDSGRKHQKIKLNELQVQCRLWNCVKKEGFCKVNTDQRISKNHILSSFGFVVMSTLGQATFQCFCEEHSWSTLLSKALCRQFLDLLVCCYLDSPKQCLGNSYSETESSGALKFDGKFYWCEKIENLWFYMSLLLLKMTTFQIINIDFQNVVFDWIDLERILDKWKLSCNKKPHVQKSCVAHPSLPKKCFRGV